MNADKFKEMWANLGCPVTLPSQIDLNHPWSQENREFLKTCGMPTGYILYSRNSFNGFSSLEVNIDENKNYLLKGPISFYTHFNMPHVIVRKKKSSYVRTSIEAPNLLTFFLILQDCLDAQIQLAQHDNLSEGFIEDRTKKMKQHVEKNLGCVTQFWEDYVASIQHDALDLLTYLRATKDTSIKNEELFDDFYRDYEDIKLHHIVILEPNLHAMCG